MARSTQLVDMDAFIKTTLPKILRTLKWSLLIDLLMVAAVGISFLFTGEFSATAYSDRLFMSGIAILAIGALVVISLAGVNRHIWGTHKPLVDMTSDKVLEEAIERRKRTELRYEIVTHLWVAGVGCLVMSVLIYLVLVNLGIGV